LFSQTELILFQR